MTEFVIRSPITEGKSNYCGITQDLSDVEHGFLVTLGLGLKECTGISLLDQRGENFLCKHLEKQTSMLRGEYERSGWRMVVEIPPVETPSTSLPISSW